MADVIQLKTARDYEADLDAHRINWETAFVDAENQEEITSSDEDKEAVLSVRTKACEQLEKFGESWGKRKGVHVNLNQLFEEFDVPEYVEHVWYTTFPIDFRTSKKIALAAQRMPRDSVEMLVYPFVPVTGPKKKFFEALCGFGRAVGLYKVGDELFKGACSGDPRAVKMYLEMLRVIGDETDTESGGVRLEFSLGYNSDSDSDSESQRAALDEPLHMPESESEAESFVDLGDYS